MKIAYFHCFSGISGDMTLGALVDAGLSFQQLQEDLAGLLLTGFRLEKDKVTRQGIGGTRIRVITEEGHVHRGLGDIRKIINDSRLPDEVKEKSVDIFTRLARAEARVHRTEVEEIHFHEVGAVDAIVDIVGAVSGLWRLGIEEVYASPVHTGTGFVNCAHGIIPVPAPATVELLKGVPVYSQGIESELATPTGAAILTSYCRHFGQMPPMRLLSCGYGAGERDLSIPNLLRLQVGEKIEGVSGGTLRLGGRGEIGQEEVLLLEANIDDMNPEFYDYLIDIFLEAGAMEVFFHPIQMKKNRPGVLLKLLIKSWQLEEFARLLLAETSSIGLRAYPATKLMLPYEIISIETELGTARVKVATSGDRIRNISPEYEDCRKIARERKKPLKEVYDLIKGEANRFLQTKDRP